MAGGGQVLAAQRPEVAVEEDGEAAPTAEDASVGAGGRARLEKVVNIRPRSNNANLSADAFWSAGETHLTRFAAAPRVVMAPTTAEDRNSAMRAEEAEATVLPSTGVARSAADGSEQLAAAPEQKSARAAAE